MVPGAYWVPRIPALYSSSHFCPSCQGLVVDTTAPCVTEDRGWNSQLVDGAANLEVDNGDFLSGWDGLVWFQFEMRQLVVQAGIKFTV